jgi:uncharacterized repeat protein (TIGR03803 family)
MKQNGTSTPLQRYRPKGFGFALLATLFVLVVTMLAAPASAAAQFKVLYAFKGETDGSFPAGSLVFDHAGNLYGTTRAGGTIPEECTEYHYPGCGTVFVLTPLSGGRWKELVLHRFQLNDSSDGSSPNGSLVFSRSGVLYGTTLSGGGGNEQCSSQARIGCGVVFELKRKQGKWKEAVLYRFPSSSAGPNGGLLSDQAGNLYGTTVAGGICCAPIFGWGAGTVFELVRANGWNENILYSFCSEECSDGNAPYAGMIWDTDGSLLGTTAYGGRDIFPCPTLGCGTAFRLTRESNGRWREHVIHTFRGADGVQPESALVPDAKGNLYGTTVADGAFGFGTVFQLHPTGGGWSYRVLYDFRNGSFEGSLATKPVLDASGNLYGTMITGGSGNCFDTGCGLVYRLSPVSHGEWKFTVIHSFSGTNDGGYPLGDLILDSKGNLYGTGAVGGTPGSGVVFEITP